MGWLEHIFNSAERMDKIELGELKQLMELVESLKSKLAEAHGSLLLIQNNRYAGRKIPDSVREKLIATLKIIQKNLQEDIALAGDISRIEREKK